MKILKTLIFSFMISELQLCGMGSLYQEVVGAFLPETTCNEMMQQLDEDTSYETLQKAKKTAEGAAFSYPKVGCKLAMKIIGKDHSSKTLKWGRKLANRLENDGNLALANSLRAKIESYSGCCCRIF